MDINTDRRADERLYSDGEVVLRFERAETKGLLVDLSAGGVLGKFSRNDYVPQILESVTVDVKVEFKSIEGIEGLVVRLQATEALRESEHIKIAVKFENMDPQKTGELKILQNLRHREGESQIK